MLDIAVGVFLALAAMRLVDHALEAARDRRRVRQLRDGLVGAADNFIDKMHDEMMKEKEAEAAKARKPRRKPAAKKVVAKKPVAKKGATNAKAKTRR